MMNSVTRSISKQRQALLTSCGVALAVSLIANPADVSAQTPVSPPPTTGAFQGTFSTPQVLTPGGRVDIARSATTDIITISSENFRSVNAVINWTPTDMGGSGTINFLPTGTLARFQSTGIVNDFTVLNRIIPENASRGIRFDGTVQSRIGDVQGGNVWFYSPGGIIAGARSVFDVGGLVLTANDIDITGGLFDSSVAGDTIRFRGIRNSQSQIEIERGARISANNYVAMVAPRIVQSGSVSVDGSVGYIAAEQVDVRISGGLFDIEFREGTAARRSAIEHTGVTTGPSSSGGGDDQRIYIAAYPKNDAITVLVGGTLGYERASSAFIENGQIVLSAGSSIFDTGLSDGERRPSPVAADISIGRDLGRDVSFTSSVTATASNDIFVTPRSGATINVEGSLSLSAGRSVEIGADAGEAILVSGDLNVSNVGSAANAAIYLNANRGLGDPAAQGLISVGGDLSLTSTRDLERASIRAIIDGGRIDVGGRATFATSDFVNGSSGVGGSTVLELRSAGSVFDGRDLSFFANASSTPAVDADGGIVGGLSDAGLARITVSNGTFSAQNVSLQAESRNTPGNSGSGGQSLFEVSGGTATLGSLTLSSNAVIGGESPGGFGTPAIGNLQGGTSALTVTGGALSIARDLTLSADANVQNNPFSSGDIVGGNAIISASPAATITVGRRVQVSATGGGSGLDSDDVSSTTRGGQVDILTTGGTMRFGSLDVDAGARGLASLSRGGNARGGQVNISATGSGALRVDGSSLVRSSARGGEGLTGGDASAGGISVLANGGTFNAVGLTTAEAIGAGGSALENQFSQQSNGIRSGSGTGGTIDIRSGVVNGTGSTLQFTSLSADASGRSAVLTGNGTPIDGASGGTGTGGTINFTINSGIVSGNQLSLLAIGAGGNGAAERSSASAGSGGLGVGGRVTATLAGGSGNIGSIGLTATGSGGGAGQGANDVGYGSFNAAGNGGAGTGGAANLTLGSSTITTNAITLLAGGTGSRGGGSSSRVGGIGGAGSAGSARLLLIQDPVIPAITINTDSQGGQGGTGVTGGAGGNAINTTVAALDVTIGALTATTLTVSANATGGAGGQGTSGTGGIGGSATAGTARASSSGATAELIAPNLTVTANATGGVGGNGATGGAATGGTVAITGTGGIFSSARLIGSATGTGGAGGLSTAGRGGAGGAGTGGGASVSNVTVTGSDSFISIDTTGFGGAGGNGRSGGAGGNGFGGSGANGGAFLTLARGLISVDGGASLLSDGRGGRGGSGTVFTSFGQPGGNGGNGTAGAVGVALSGASTRLVTSSLILSASGFGGATGANSSSPGVPVSPSGGDARGGSVALSSSSGARLTASDVVSITANANATSGQNGQSNADSDGGNGGSAIAGTVLVAGSNGGVLASGLVTTISADANAGNGGNGGAIILGNSALTLGRGGNGGNATAGRVEATFQTDNGLGAVIIRAGANGGNGGLSDDVQGNGGNALAAANGGAFVSFDSGSNVTASLDINTAAKGGAGRNAGNASAGNSSLTIMGANTSLNAPTISQLATASGGLARNSNMVGSGGVATGGNVLLSLSGATATLTSTTVTLNTAATAGNGGSAVSSLIGQMSNLGGNGGAASAGAASLTVTDSGASIAAITSDISAIGGNAGQGASFIGAPGTSGSARAGSFTLTQNGGTLARAGADPIALSLLANASGGAGGNSEGAVAATSGGSATGGNLTITINAGALGTKAKFISSLNLSSRATGGNGGNALSGANAVSGAGGAAFGGTNSLSVNGPLTEIGISGLTMQSSALGGVGGSGGSGGNGGDATQGRNTVAVTDQAILRLQQTQSISTTTTGGAGGNANAGGNGGTGGNARSGGIGQGISIVVSQANLTTDALTFSANGTGGRGGNGNSGQAGQQSLGTGDDGNNGIRGDSPGANGFTGTAGGAGGNGGNGANGGSGGNGGIGEGGSIRIDVNDNGSGLGDALLSVGNITAIAQGVGGLAGNGAAAGDGTIGGDGGKGGSGGDGALGQPGQDLGGGNFGPGGRGGNGGNGADGGVGGNGGNGGNGGSGGFGGTALGGTVSLIVESGTASVGALGANVDGRGGIGGNGGAGGIGAVAGIGGIGGVGGRGALGGFGNPVGARGDDGSNGASGADGLAGTDGLAGVGTLGLASVGKGGAIVIRVGNGSNSNAALTASAVNLSASGRGDFSDGLPANGTIDISNTNRGAAPRAIAFNSLTAVADSPFSAFGITGITVDAGVGGISIADSAQLTSTENVSISATGPGKLAILGDINVSAGGGITISHLGGSGEAISSRSGSYTAVRNINAGAGIASGVGTIVRTTDRLNLASISGSISADNLQSVNELRVLAGRTATIGSAKVTGAPIPLNSLNGGLIDIQSGFILSAQSFNFENTVVSGELSATGSIRVRAGGDLLVGSGAKLLSDNFITLASGGDIRVATGAVVSSALNVAPDVGFGTQGDITVSAGGLIPTTTPAGDISSFVAGNASFSATGHLIVLNADAIAASDATFASQNFSAIINDAPLAGAPRRNDRGLLTAPCAEGNICIGTITATQNISLGAQTGSAGLPNQIFTYGQISGANISIRATDTVELNSSNSLAPVLARNSLSVASLNGNINLMNAANIAGGSNNASFYAAGSINGAEASISTPGDLGLFAGTRLNLGSVSSGGVLNTINSDGQVTVAGALSLAVPVNIGVLAVTGGNADIRSNNITIGTAATRGNLLLTGARIALGQTSGQLATPIDIIATGSDVQVGNIAATGNIRLTGDQSVRVQVAAVADGELVLNSALGGITAATLTGRSVGLTSATAITAGNVTATNGDISIRTAGNISTGDLTASRGSVALFNQIGTITAGLITARDDFTLMTGSDLTFAGVSVGDDIRITTTGAATLGRLTTTGLGTDSEADRSNIVLRTGGALTVDHANSAGNFTANAARFETGLNTIITAGDIDITSVGDTLLGNSQAGGFIRVNSGGLIGFNTISSGFGTTLAAVSTATGSSATAGLALSISGASGVSLGTSASTNGDILLSSSSGGVSYVSANAGRNFTVTAQTDIVQTGTAIVARDARFTGGNVRIASITIGDDLDITSRGLVDLTSALTLRTPIDTGNGLMSDDSNISVNAAGAITMGSVRAVDNLTITGTSLTATSLIAGQNLIAAVTSNSNIGTTNGGSLVQVTTSGLNRVGTATSARGDVNLRANFGIIELGDATAGRDIILGAFPGAVIHTGTATAARSVSVTGNSVALGSMTAGDDIGITSFGSLTAASLTTTGTSPMLGAGSDIIVNVMLGTSPVTITNANAFSALSITTTGTAELGTSRAGTDLAVTARSISAGNSSAGAALSLTSTIGDIVTANLTGASVTANSAGMLTAGNIVATASDINLTAVSGITTGDITASLGSVSLNNRFGLIRTGLITARNDFTLTTGSDLTFGGVSVGDDIRITTTGSATLGRLTTTGAGTDNESDLSNIVLSAGGALSVVHANSANDFTAAATRFETGLNTIITAGDIDITTTNDALLGNSQAGGVISVNAGGLIDFNAISSGGSTRLFTGGNVTGISTTSGNGTLISARGISVGSATSGDGLEYRSFGGGVINVGQSTAAGDVLVSGQGNVTLGTATANGTAGPNSFSNGGNIFVVTTGNAAIGSANARGMIGVSANGVSGSGTWTAGEDIYVDARTSAALTNLSAGDDLDIFAPGGISLTNGEARGDARDDRSLQLFNGSVGGLFLIRETPNDGADIRLSSVNASSIVRATNLTAADDIIATTDGAVIITGLAQTRGIGVIGDGSDVVITAGSATSASATAFNNLTVTTSGDATLGTSQAGNGITVNSGQAVGFAALTSGSFTQIDAEDDVIGGTVQAGSTLIVSSRGSVIAGNVSAPSLVQINGATGIALGNIASTNGEVTLNSTTGGITFADATVGQNLIVTTPLGNIRQTGVANVARDARFNGGTVRIAAITVGDDLDIISAGLVDLASALTLRTPIMTDGGLVSDDSNIVITAAGAVTTGTLRAVDNLTVTGSSLGATSLTAGQTLLATIAGSSNIGTANGGSLVQVTTNGANNVTTATSTRGDVTLIATPGGAVNAGTLTAGRDINLSALSGGVAQTGVANAARDVVVDGRTVSLGTVTAGARIGVTSAAGIGFTSLSSGTSANLQAGGSITGGAVSATTGAVAFNGQSADVGQLTAGTTISGTTTGLARMAGATSGGAFTLNAGQTNLGSVRAGSIAVTSGQGVIFNQLVSAGTTALNAGDDIVGNLISSTGALTARAGRNITVPTITAGSVDAQAGGTAAITTLTASGAATIAATNGIDVASASTGGALGLRASNGAVLVSTNLAAIGSVTATGREVSLRSIGALDVAQATATNGGITLSSGGNLNVTSGQASGAVSLASTGGDVSGSNLTASAGDIILSGRNVTLSGIGDASGAIRITTPGLATLAGRALATTIDVRSGNIAVGATGQIGAQGRTLTATFANTGNSVTTIGGAGVQTGYSLSNAEIGRVFAGDIVINAPRVGQSGSSTGQVSTALSSRAPDVILDTLTLSGANGVAGATAGNIGTSGRLTINTTGKLRAVGAATFNNLTSGNQFVINASDAIEVDAATGLISLRNASGGLGGTLVLTSSDVIAASASAISDVINAANIGAINDRLSRNDGATIDEGYLRADTINVSVGNNFFVQNSGATSANLRNYSDRRGISVGAGGLNIRVDGSASRIVINGQQVDSTGSFVRGVDFLRSVKINSGTVALGTVTRGLFDFGSTINGCAILNIASCQVSFDDRNIARDVINRPALGDARAMLPETLVELKEVADVDFQPLIDDPVTGAGNDDNWATDGQADCAPGDESCAEPK